MGLKKNGGYHTSDILICTIFKRQVKMRIKEERIAKQTFVRLETSG